VGQEALVASNQCHPQHLFNEVVALEDPTEDVDEKLTGREWRASEHAAHAEVVENGPVRGRIRVRGRLINSTLEQDITLYAALPRLDLSTRIDWEGRRSVQVRLAMPFNVPGGRITYESPYAHVTMPDDEMPNTYRGTGGRFTGKWINVSDGKLGVTLASRLGCHSLSGTSIYPVLLRNTYSCGTPFYWYPQYGLHTFDFALAAHAGDWRSPECFRLGWAFNNPLRVGRMCTARPIKPIAGRARLPESGGFCSADRAGVIISTIKKAYDGSGHVVRLVEMTGEPGPVRLAFDTNVLAAEETDLLERPVRGLRSEGGSVTVPVTAYGIHSVKVRLRRSDLCA
jgi:alpha-mannosidase